MTGEMVMSEIARLFNVEMDVVRCPFPIYHQLQEAAHVQFVEDVGCFVVTGYDEVVSVLQDSQTFASQDVTGAGTLMRRRLEECEEGVRRAGLDPEEMVKKWGQLLLIAADPEHARYRTLLGKAFAPSHIRELEAPIRQVCMTLVDGFGDEEVEFASAFAIPLPMTAIATLIGVPINDLPTFRSWSDVFTGAVGGSLSEEGVITLFRTLNDFESYFTQQLTDRLQSPQNDVLTDVAHAYDDGHLTHRQAMCYLLELLAAGNETTTNHLLNTMQLILRRPGTWERLRADHSLVKKIIEESLRLEAPIQGFYRTATSDVTIGGVSIPAGARVYISYAAANRDPQQFSNPDTLEIERANATRHITFGRGPHTCLGAPLARLEARMALEVLVERFACATLASPDEGHEYLHSYINRGLHRLRIVFT
jgi:cytochrome P450